MRTLTLTLLILAAPLLPACAGTRIELAESFGYAKREQLVDRVQDARDGQEAAKEQFASALEEFLALTQVEGGELESTYSRLSRELDRSESRANQVRERITSVERVANALFREWRDELDDYTNADLRRASERQLTDTQQTYDRLIEAMRRAESKMDPVLNAFRDQVLFLKHNLNARAIASLSDTFAGVEADV
ncbi:MAG: DUF2959 family protein, partial [Planctomycetota bacterium]|nr:DUF2959 family protein [Planctomycetota bacterium]